jgi:hypothetical protein
MMAENLAILRQSWAGQEVCWFTPDLFDLGPLHVDFCLGAKQIPRLLVGKTSVYLCHKVLLPEDYSSGVHFSSLETLKID